MSPDASSDPERASLDFLVRRDDWGDCRFRTAAIPPLEDGQALLRVDRFALTANNVTYALAGDLLDYWGFFPAGEPGMGRIPVMGFGDVVASRQPDLSEGVRVFGFFPMSSHLLVQPEAVGATGFADGAAHRAKHAPTYRQYTRVDADPLYEGTASEDALMLLRGLFLTGFLIDDFLDESGFFGAPQVVVTSASSKTSIALAFQLARREGVRSIGLTSVRNRGFVERLGYYDDVVLYEDVAKLAASAPAVLVDMAGNAEVRKAVHQRFGERLVHHCAVGATHWSKGGGEEDLPGAKPAFFFAPARIVQRSKDWGPGGFQKRVGEGWRRFETASRAWLRVERGAGPAEVERVYRELLAGRARPEAGHVLSLSAGS
jgi:hypothetical protein